MTEHSPSPDGRFEGLGNETEALPELRAPRRRRSVGRRWSRADKWRIVEESYQPGTSVSLVARRYDVNANQVFNSRREARDGRLGNSPEFWLNVQRRSDLWEAIHSPRERARIERAKPLQTAA